MRNRESMTNVSGIVRITLKGVKEVSVEHAITRIREIDLPGSEVSLRSTIALDPDAESRTRVVATDDGPLTGVPVVVKDNVEAVGLPASAGSLALLGVPVVSDSTIVRRLRRAGAVVIAASNLSEWANIRSTRSSSGWSAVGGLVANPWMLDRSAGGSSSGSGAAVAAGIVPMAVGTETDGSITCPAALNGVVGIKPTVGVVPTDGVVPVSGSQDAPGSLARNVGDATTMLAVLADDPNLLARSERIDVGMVRVGATNSWRIGHAATDDLFDAVLGDVESFFGAMSDSVVEPTPDEVIADEFTVLVHELRTDLDAYLVRRCVTKGPRSMDEIVEFNRAHRSIELEHFGQEIFEMAVAGEGRAASVHREARHRNIEWVRSRLLPEFERHDVLVAPAYAPAWKTDLVLGHPAAGGAVTTPAAIAGLPIVTIPMGLVAGLPVGLSLVGTARSEDLLIAVARTIEARLALVDDPEWRPRFLAPGRG